MSETTWRVGEVTITAVVETDAGKALNRILPQATQPHLDAIPWLRPYYLDSDGRLQGLIQAICVATPSQRLIVDTCVGNDKIRPQRAEWDRMRTGFLDDLTAAGFAPEGVDMVMCTHLHVDHVGWNTRLVGDKWVPTFPNARYLMAETELAHWRADKDDLPRQILSDSIQPIFDAGLVDTVAMDARLGEGVTLVPTPGHTPGHTSVLIESRGERGLITGDFVHHPCQFAYPDWSSIVDTDPDEAAATRREIFARYADTPTLIVGTHFSAPSAGRLVRDGDAYRLDA